MYENIATALRMCGYPWSVYYCGHGCPFAKDGGACDVTPLLSAAASVIDHLNETLNDYRAACKKAVEK